MPGAPLHEVVGEVVQTASADLKPGDVVVGWANRFDGLADYLITDAHSLHAYQIGLPPEEAVAMQPLACVLYAVERVGSVAGLTCTVFGLGPIGLLFCHVLKERGAARVIGVDRVNRSALAPLFGVDEVVWATSQHYAARVAADSRPDVIIEAVGHQVTTLQDAVSAIGDNGRIFYFGVPDDEVYPINMQRLLRGNITLMSGTTLDRQRVLAEAEQYLGKFPELVGAFITHRFSRADVQRAFEVAVTACEPGSRSCCGSTSPPPDRWPVADRTAHSSSHSESSLVAVERFLAVAATAALAGVPMMRNTTWASSLVPNPSGVCTYSAGPVAVISSRRPLAVLVCSAVVILASRSDGSLAFRNTTWTSFGFGSPVYGLAWRIWASSSRDTTTTDTFRPNASVIAASRPAASLAVFRSAVLNSTLPLWM